MNLSICNTKNLTTAIFNVTRTFGFIKNMTSRNFCNHYTLSTFVADKYFYNYFWIQYLWIINLNSLLRDALGQTSHVFIDLFDNLGFVKGQKLTITHDDLSIDDDRLHIAGAGVVNQAGGDAVQRLVMRSTHIDQNDVGQVFRFNGEFLFSHFISPGIRSQTCVCFA